GIRFVGSTADNAAQPPDVVRDSGGRARWSITIRDVLRLARLRPRRALRLVLEYWTIHRSQVFDRDFYLAKNPDVAGARIDPLWHYLRFGEGERRRPSKSLSHIKLCNMVGEPSAVSGSLLARFVREGATLRPASGLATFPRGAPPRRNYPELPPVRYAN